MLPNLLSIIVNLGFCIVLNMDLYSDTAYLPDGKIDHLHLSPVDKLYAADKAILWYLQLAFAAISIITGVLLLFGFKSRIIRTVWLTGLIASLVMFIIIILYSVTVHLKY